MEYARNAGVVVAHGSCAHAEVGVVLGALNAGIIDTERVRTVELGADGVGFLGAGARARKAACAVAERCCGVVAFGVVGTFGARGRSFGFSRGCGVGFGVACKLCGCRTCGRGRVFSVACRARATCRGGGKGVAFGARARVCVGRIAGWVPAARCRSRCQSRYQSQCKGEQECCTAGHCRGGSGYGRRHGRGGARAGSLPDERRSDFAELRARLGVAGRKAESEFGTRVRRPGASGFGGCAWCGWPAGAVPPHRTLRAL